MRQLYSVMRGGAFLSIHPPRLSLNPDVYSTFLLISQLAIVKFKNGFFIIPSHRKQRVVGNFKIAGALSLASPAGVSK